MKNKRFTIYIGGLSGILMTLLSAGASFSDSTSAENTSAHERTVMSKVSFGNHSAIRVPHSLQEKIRQFYRDVLGCEITKTTYGMDYFRMGDNFFVAFLYDDSALAEPVAERFKEGDAICWREFQRRVCEMCAHAFIHHVEDRGGSEVESALSRDLAAMPGVRYCDCRLHKIVNKLCTRNHGPAAARLCGHQRCDRLPALAGQ